MRFPAFWALGRHGPASAWGWSDASLAEARELGDRRAKSLSDLLRRGDRPPRRGEYYPDRPLREPVLRELADADGAVGAVVSRNAYGAEILNAADALFVDVDLPPPRRPGLLARLLGAKAPAPGSPSPAEEAVLAQARAWARSHPGWGWRAYRTAAGLRLLATHAPFDPADPLVAAAFEALGADPLYRRLCSAQRCFRARLTPKPWRVGIRDEPPRWPWAGPGEERAFIAWDRAYRVAAGRHAACELAAVIGSTEVHPALRDLLALHDAACRVGSGLPLA